MVAQILSPAVSHAQVLGDPVDIGQDFQKLENVYFIGSRVTAFDTATGQGNLQWDRYWRNTTLSFNKVDVGFVRGKASEFPTTEYDQDPVLPFSIAFVSPRTIRLRVSTRAIPIVDGQSLMLAGPVPKDSSWRVEQNEREIIYTGAHGRARINKQQAPLTGQYASGLSGWYEHNLYPLRYNKIVGDITKATTGEDIVWARSAWAGSQRYPVHWGGDAENTDSAMAASLRGGLSFGLSGFTYWSHDVGGFVQRPPRELYRRWMAWGVLSSHTRAHGIPPREPWEYDAALTDDFRRALNLRYSLMPYIYAQAKDSSARGFPMLRPLFFEYPNDPGSWTIDDQYLFGTDLLVAPMFTNGDRRRVYLPPGVWIDYQSGRVYQGAAWHEIQVGQIPVVLLVKDHSVLPHIKVAQSTKEMDWDNVELRVFSTDNAQAKELFTRPGGDVQTLTVVPRGRSFVLAQDPQAGRVKWTINKMNE